MPTFSQYEVVPFGRKVLAGKLPSSGSPNLTRVRVNHRETAQRRRQGSRLWSEKADFPFFGTTMNDDVSSASIGFRGFAAAIVPLVSRE
jgi:hypothetical protein